MFVGFITSDMLDDLSLSDLDSKENSFSTSNDFGNLEECSGKALSVQNNPLELQNTFSLKKP